MEEAARHENVIAVDEVYLEVGELAFLNTTQMMFAFDTLKKDTVLADAQMLIVEILAYVKCRNCDYAGPLEDDGSEEHHFSTPLIMCPKCNGRVEVLNGQQCIIRNVKMRVEGEDEKEAKA